MMASSSLISLAGRRILVTACSRIALNIPQQAKLLSTAAHIATTAGKVEEVTFLRLNNLKDNPGAVKKKRRVGRGIGSSKGKTCGKGHKGQRARNKSSIPTGFEGGQTKFWKTLPKKGFSNKVHRQKQNTDFVPINLGTIQDYIDMGRLKIDTDNDDNNTTPLGVNEFIEAGMLKKTPSLPGVKLLAKGKERFHSPNVRLVVNRASVEAIEHTENLGGQVVCHHFNRLAMRALIAPHKFPQLADGSGYLLPKQARPPPKMQPYYTSWKNRGYLCPQVQMREWLRHNPTFKETFEAALETIVEEEGSEEVEDKES